MSYHSCDSTACPIQHGHYRGVPGCVAYVGPHALPESDVQKLTAALRKAEEERDDEIDRHAKALATLTQERDQQERFKWEANKRADRLREALENSLRCLEGCRLCDAVSRAALQPPAVDAGERESPK